MSLPLPAAVLLVTLHAPGGQPVYVNPENVSSVREPRTINRTHFAPGTKCVLIMTNGLMVSVVEGCAEVFARLQEKE
jgi:hypothetical protein